MNVLCSLWLFDLSEWPFSIGSPITITILYLCPFLQIWSLLSPKCQHNGRQNLKLKQMKMEAKQLNRFKPKCHVNPC